MAVPVLLILAVVLLMPRRAELSDEFHRSQPFSRKHYEGGSAERYAIVIDAGSTGSRVHIFKFLSKNGKLELQFDKFDQLKPGLSSYADDPAAAAQSLTPLVELAKKTVPLAQHSSTPIMVGATAGLRLLPDGKADLVLDEVRMWLGKCPFHFKPAENVKILSGVDEGAFAWLTLNYLLGRLGKAESETVAAIDLGGGSVQEAYAMTEPEAEILPDQQYLTTLNGGGRKYNVYVYSYLGYGLMAGRAGILSENTASQEAHPCVPAGYEGSYEYGGKNMSMMGGNIPSTADECGEIALKSLKHTLECGAPQLQCTFNGAWGGPKVPKVFYISSYFWDRASDAGLVAEDAIEAYVKPSAFVELAEKACAAGLEEIAMIFPKVHEDIRPFFCMDLSYVHTLLIKGFKVPDETQVTLVKKVEYNGEHIEAAWPLGAAINLM